jgi:hypothetical protein
MKKGAQGYEIVVYRSSHSKIILIEDDNINRF